jgi:hypothetical protein
MRGGGLRTAGNPGFSQSVSRHGKGAKPDAEDRRGGSGGGNVGAFPGTGSRGVGRVGPSARKITRARKEKRPGTSGGGRKQEGEASNRDSFRRNPPLCICSRVRH